NNELADIELEGCIELSVFLGHGKSSMGIVSPIEVSGVIRPAHLLPEIQISISGAYFSGVEFEADFFNRIYP
ncbi:hypothetical protein, partial [Pseudomonas viridiflava]|uniref:hypothetical protein n=1 Tax=Pseudomonas viridiflava TaxID=33069 RepID=UPI0019D26ECE